MKLSQTRSRDFLSQFVSICPTLSVLADEDACIRITAHAFHNSAFIR